MVNLRRTFFYFLRLGLWNIDIPYTGASLSLDDWKNLFAMAQAQAVTGLFIDGVGRSSFRPPGGLWDQWILHLLFLEQMNERLVDFGERWLHALKQHGISSQLFKGASVAKWYFNPLHRSFGDIDLVISKDWNRLTNILRDENVAYSIENGDLVITDHAIRVEFHPTWDFLYNPFLNVRLQKLLGQSNYISNELYFICLIIHLRRHFLTYGIGLKQVCDVAVMLKTASLDFEKIRSLVRYLHIERFSRCLFGFIKTHLNCIDVYPLQPIIAGSNFLLFQHVILEEGFCLRIAQDKQARASSSSLVRIFKNLFFWMQRAVQLLYMMPCEMFFFLLSQTKNRVKKIFKD